MYVRIYYEDTDCGGIVYHTNYIKFCERARSEIFFKHNILPQRDYCGFVLRSLKADFIGSARLGDLLYVQTKAIDIRKVQLSLKQDIFIVGNASNLEGSLKDLAIESSNKNIKDSIDSKNLGEAIFSAVIKLGYVDILKQRPATIPEDFIGIFNQLIKAD